jgi:hypothetical protein
MVARRSALTLLSLALAGGLAFGQEVRHNTHSIMHFSKEWMKEHHQRRASLPVTQATPEEYLAILERRPGDTMGVDLSSHMNFASCGGKQGWDQGQCGNCWVFGSTAASSIDDGVASGTPQLFSTQWFDSDYYATVNQSTCQGGDDTTFASWYDSHANFLPWTNTNAGYADGNGPSTPAMPASSIAQSPSVGVGRITVTQIATSGVSQAQAIANIKSVLDKNQPVTLSFFLPSQGWTDFDNFWDSDSETTPWASVDAYNGQSQAGGHLVCVVGYDDTNNSWLIQNSWGTTGGRPDGTFELSQTMGYGDTVNSGGTYDMWEFDTFSATGWSNASTSAPAITTQPASQTVTVGASATFTVVASGAAPLTYKWYQGSTAISGATSASYKIPAATAAESGTTFHVVVSNATGSATSNNATLTVTTANTGPAITAQPANQTVAVGASATFKVVASGTAPLTYQWYQGSTAIGGATSASYTLPAATAAESGTTFHVVVRNASGSATSNPATLTVTSSVGTNLIVNGGFESGATGWVATSGVIGQFGTLAPPYAGTWDAWLCGNGASMGMVSQMVTLPSTVTRATLAFYLHIAGGSGKGTFKAVVLNSSGTVLTTLATYTQANAATGYQAHSFDLSAYKGQTVAILFTGMKGRSRSRRGGTSFTLDNVSLDTQ